ncbi:MAG: DsrE family protein [Phycisphaerales bacterium]|nr:DsrE family protein [Planctomycetota bacterium]MCH8507572.1 DsrE family protein [Phycisphaerales bacterium]
MPSPQPHSNTLPAILLALLLAGAAWFAFASDQRPSEHDAQPNTQPDALTIVWTSADPDVAHRMVLMYATGAQRQEWFADIRLIIWGPSQRLVVADKDIRAKIQALQQLGVEVVACLACADSYGIADDLREAGLEVRYMGAPLSEDLKSDRRVITF